MKKRLLAAALLLTGTSSFAQGLTQANEPAIGTTSQMFLCDSFATNYANVTGAGVTWDYSGISGFAGETRSISILDPATTPNASTFPTANKAVMIENLLTTYWTSTATERTSTGFVFEEPSLGTVVGNFSQNPQTLAAYEFALNDQLTDTYAGTVNLTLGNFPSTGTVHAKIDGSGTLKLNGSTTLNNVIRYVSQDTMIANTGLLGDIQMVRVQYEYYQLGQTSMPVFIHSYGKIGPLGGSPLSEFTVVLSSVEPDNFVSVKETQKVNFSVFPNPAKEKLTVTGEFANASAKIIDQSGREVKSVGAVAPGSSIEINELQKGIYFLVLTANGASSVQKFSKN